MDLETDAGSIGQATPAGRRLSVEVEAVQEDVDEPPRKRQRTELPDALSGRSSNPEEIKVMEGESYSKILSGELFFLLAYIQSLSRVYRLLFGVWSTAASNNVPTTPRRRK